MAEAQGSIRIVAVPGSVRPGNFTVKALGLVLDEIGKHADIALDVIDPVAIALPLPGMADGSPATQNLIARVNAATGVVLATPEYHGSYSSIMKLVIENLGFPSVLAGKSVALLSGYLPTKDDAGRYVHASTGQAAMRLHGVNVCARGH